MIKNMRSFTIMELMITVVLVGIIAGFGIPTYNRILDKADERNAILNLSMIRAATVLYLDRTGDPNIPNSVDLADINNIYNLNIVDTKMTYRCDEDIGILNDVCRATHINNGWTLRFHDAETNIHCTDASCPSCEVAPVGCNL